jgi:N-acetylglucosamine-6-phosphate deacetylase
VLPFLKRRPGNALTNSEILGAHVEGPFISEEKKGAHDSNVIRSAPNGIKDFDDAYGPELKHGGEAVCIMTVAPEIDGVLDAMPHLIKRGITVSLGHSAAHVKAAEAGVAKGACLMTHLFNAMLPVSKTTHVHPCSHFSDQSLCSSINVILAWLVKLTSR